MDRVATLTEAEYKILTTIRKVMEDDSVTKQSSAQDDMRNELENIYHDLRNMTSYNQNEVINEVSSRIYSMLY